MWRILSVNTKVLKVKNKLLELGYIDNKWLNKYLEILETNLSTPRNQKTAQAHHAIPVSAYWHFDEPYNRKEALKLANTDNNNFKVNLIYKDHLLIHSYLTMCTDLNEVQRRYEAQADLRKRRKPNNRIGVDATNKSLNKKQTKRYKTASAAYVRQYCSASETDEIMNL